MKIDLRTYAKSAPFVRYVVETKPAHYEDVSVVNSAACAVHTPVIACMYYYAHYFGMKPWVEKKIAFLTQFYGYTRILGLEDFPSKPYDNQEEKNV